MLKNLEPFKAVNSFGNSQKSDMAKSGKYGGLSNFITDVFGQKIPHSKRTISRVIAMMQDSSLLQ